MTTATFEERLLIVKRVQDIALDMRIVLLLQDNNSLPSVQVTKR